jgi:hypothetical protein
VIFAEVGAVGRLVDELGALRRDRLGVPAILWLLGLSSRTISSGRKVGANICSPRVIRHRVDIPTRHVGFRWVREKLTSGRGEPTRSLGNQNFRATGITAYLKNSGTIETAAAIANHASRRTTQLYDRRRDEVKDDPVRA